MLKKFLAVLLTAAMLLSMVAVTASAAGSASFDDTENNWASSSIERWAENDVIHGNGSGLFQPGKKMTRAEFAALLCQLLKIDDPGTVSFTDLDGHWGAKAMRTLANAGILSGVGGGKADPDGLITREQAFALLARALHIPESTSDEKLPGVSGWAQGAVKALTERGIVKGTVAADGTVELAPLQNIDKASMASLLDRTITTYANKEGAYENKAENGVVLVVTDGAVTVSGEAAAVVVPSAGEGADVTLDKAVVTEGVTVDAPDVTVTVTASKVDGGVDLTENADKAKVEVASGSTVDTVTTAANDVIVEGEGEVKNVEVTGGKVDVTTAGTAVKVDEAATDAAVTAGGAEVKPGENTTIGGSGTGYEEEPTPTPSDNPPAPTTYSVTFDVAGGQGGPATMTGKNEGDEITMPTTVPTKTGYTFGGWTAPAGVEVTGGKFTMPAKSVKFTATWTAITYTVNFDLKGGKVGAETTVAAFTATYDVAITLPSDPTKDNFTFVGWNTNAAATEALTTPIKNLRDTAGEVTLNAIWRASTPTPTTYTITFHNNDGTETTSTATTGTDGKLATIPAGPTRNGYTFNGWFDAATGGNKVTTDTVFTSNDDVYAQWTPTTVGYTITFHNNDGTDTTTNAQTNANGNLTTDPADPERSGYTFKGWYSAATDGTKYADDLTTVTFADDTDVYAQWTQNHTVTYDTNDGGTAPTQEPVAEGSTFTLNDGSGLSKTGYTFGGWNDGTSNYPTNVTTYTMGTADVTLTAIWQPISYTISFNANGGTGTIANIESVKYGTDTTLTTNTFTKAGYTFQGWAKTAEGQKVYDDGATVSNLANTDGATVTLFAVWAVDTHYVVTPTTAILADAKGEISTALYDTDSYSVTNTPATGATDGVITSTITAANLVPHWNNANPKNKGYWIGIALVKPEDKGNVTITGLKRGKGATKDAATAMLNGANGVYADENGLILEGNVAAGGKTGYTLYVDAAALDATNGTWLAVQWLTGTKESNSTVGPVTYYNIKKAANLTMKTTKATLTGTVTKANIVDQAGVFASEAELCTDYNATAGTINDSNEVVVTMAGSNLKLHYNADQPARWGYWAGVKITAPQDDNALTGIKMGYGDTREAATADFNKFQIYDQKTVAENTLELWADAKKTRELWIVIQWAKKNGSEFTLQDQPVYYNVKFNGMTLAEGNANESFLRPASTTPGVTAKVYDNSTTTNRIKLVVLTNATSAPVTKTSLTNDCTSDNKWAETFYPSGTDAAPAGIDDKTYVVASLATILPFDNTTQVKQVNPMLSFYADDDSVTNPAEGYTKTKSYIIGASGSENWYDLLVEQYGKVTIETTTNSTTTTYVIANYCDFAE